MKCDYGVSAPLAALRRGLGLADLFTYGKIIGGGDGVLAGKATFMDHWTVGCGTTAMTRSLRSGVTYFAGTFVRHPALRQQRCSIT